MDAIASVLVLPNRLTVPLVPDLPVAQLRSPLPRVTHVHTIAYTYLQIHSDIAALTLIYPYIHSASILIGTPVYLQIYAGIQSANHVATAQCIKSCTSGQTVHIR